MLYELRQGGRVVERVRPRPGGYEETRLGVMAADRAEKREKDGWREVPDVRPAAAGDEQGQTADGG